MQVAPPGLKGLAVSDTELGDVRGDEGFFHYRQYDAVHLARARTLEDVWTLQFNGALPPAVPRVDPGPMRDLPEEAALVVDAASARMDDPMGVLRVGLLAVAAVEGRGPLLDRSSTQRRHDAVRLAAVVPTILARHHRRRSGLEPLAPDPGLSHAADYLRMSTGGTAGPEAVRAVEQYLVVTLDHGFNVSTFASRVVASTGADMAGALVAGLGALSGPLHGGAPSRVIEMIEQIGSPERAASWVSERLAEGHKIMGFGHAVYRVRDPRGVVLRAAAESLGGDLVERAAGIEEEGARGAGPVEAQPPHPHQCRVLGVGGPGVGRGPPADVHPHLRGQPLDRLGRSHPGAGGKRKTPASRRPLRGSRPVSALNLLEFRKLLSVVF